jgi:hypothetical protein
MNLAEAPAVQKLSRARKSKNQSPKPEINRFPQPATDYGSDAERKWNIYRQLESDGLLC